MSLIFVFEPDPGDRDRIESALAAEGWTVEAGSGTSGQRPDLVVVSDAHPEAAEVAARHARSAGGPGILLLETAGRSGDLEAEGRLEKPFTDQQIRSAVRRCLARVQREVAEEAAREAASSGEQLTSADLFGDMLAEVEDEMAAGEASADAKPGAPSPPSASPAPPERPPDPSAPKTEPRRRPAARDDLDAEIERTLSGVLGGSARPKAKPPAPPKSASEEEDELDQLLSQTLSGLGVKGSRRPVEAKPAEPKPKPAPQPEGELPVAPPPESPRSEPVAPVAPVVEEAPSPSARAPETADSSEQAAADPLATQRMEAVSLPEPPEGPETPEPSEIPETPETSDAPPPAPSRPAAAAPPAEGEAFGQYTLLERVAVGGMAEVWKARMKGMEGFQKTVAIKRILPHLTDSSDFLTMFIDEAKLAAQLNHPHIIHIYDLGKIEDDYYIAMEYVEGRDLRSILNTGREESRPLPLGLALLIAARLAAGLDHAHRKRDFEDRDLGLVHRDVSPQNVLISYEGDIKLCDFGIAKAVAKASKTQMGALKGKLQYMSPEQAWGRIVDARSDIFSLGTVLFEMLTGHRLFAGDSELSVLESVRDCRTRSPREVNQEVPAEVEAIVGRALAKDPDDRYQTAGELQKDLEGVLYGLKPTPSQGDLAGYMRGLFSVEESERERPVPAVSPERPSGSEEPAEPEVAAMPPLTDVEPEESGSRRGLWIGVAAALLLIAAVVGWLAFSNRGDRADAAAEPASGLEAPSAAVPVVPATTAPEDPAAPGAEALGDAAADAGEGEVVDAGTSAATEGEDVDLQALVDAQVRERDEELRRRFEEEKRRIEEEIAAAREREEAEAAAAEPVPSVTEPETAAVGGTPGPSTNEAPAKAKAAAPATDRPAATSEPGQSTGSAQPGTPPSRQSPQSSSGVGTSDPREGERTRTDADTAAGSKAKTPAGPSLPASADPEPARPKVTPGQLVDAGTPGLSPPRLVSIDAPEYPPIARRMKVQGTVIVSVLVDESGRVQETRLVQGVSQKVGLNEAALEAARTARFQPASLEGVRVKTWFNLRIPFQL